CFSLSLLMKVVMKDISSLVLMVVFIFTISLLSVPLVSAIIINEILPNPEEYSDAEWLELFSSETINLTGFKLDTTNQIYTFNNTIITDYLVIAQNKTSFLLLWPNVPPEKIIEWSGMRLNNGGETVSLLNGSTVINTTTYPSFSSKAGKSWARLENGTFVVCNNPTPLANNNCSQQNQQEPNIQLNYPQEVQCNENFSITLNAFNFEDGSYDVKIDILDAYDESHRVGKVWNGTKWLSTNSYVNSILNIVGGNGTANLTYKVENFDGEAILRSKIRKTGSSSYNQFDDYLLEVRCQANQPEESEIRIVAVPSRAKFGSTIEIKLEVYKGDTTKYAVYVYVQDKDDTKVSDKATLHLKEKFTNYSETIELNLKCKNEQGTYEIVAEGLDTKDTKEIKLTECEENETEENNRDGEGITIGDFTYSFTIPNTIYLNQAFQVKVKITNNGDEDKSFMVWSYVYRGSKCYSCKEDNREANAKIIEVKQGSFSEAVLENIIYEESGAEPGDYKLKIKVLQEDLKTPKEFTYSIFLDVGNRNQLENKQEGIREEAHAQGTASYRSSYYSRTYAASESSWLTKTLPYVLTSIAMLLAIYLIINKI
ncbi:MAG: lamin tail domain-containing protein, partial [Candidatus Pacearchaeota archaeon]|nr:lamin tail domain-containing protein [Candidatus Pacearchaeota archaeon]